MAQDLKAGQFWRDTVNGDLLKILSFSQEPNSNAFPAIGGYVDYVRSACIVRGSFFGIQEMRAAHFSDERFQKVNWLKSLWYRRKFKSASSVHAI